MRIVRALAASSLAAVAPTVAAAPARAQSAPADQAVTLSGPSRLVVLSRRTRAA
jgi:hypothetical protein